MPRFLNFHPARYQPGSSVAHLIDARLKVLAVGVLSVAVWQVESFTGLAMILGLTAGWLMLIKGQVKPVLLSLRSLVYLFFMVLLYYVWSELFGVRKPLTAAVANAFLKSLLLTGKLAAVFIASFWLYFSTAPLKVVDALGSLLRPLERFRVPVRDFAFTVGLILRFFPASVTRIGDLYRNLEFREKLAAGKRTRSQQYSRAVGRVIDTMVLYMHYSLHESEMLTLSLVARGYNPFLPFKLTEDRIPAAWELIFFTLSTLVIILAAGWF